MKHSKTIAKRKIARLKELKVIVEKHSDGYVAYPLGLKGVVVGQGNTYDEALSDAKSATLFHIETFGNCSTTQFCQRISNRFA